MWHAAPDRRLPEINRVLEGVPDDLAHVVQKLVEKDQSKRYRSADEALSDLQIDVKILTTGTDSSPPPTDDGRRRLLVVAAFSLSLVLSLAMLFLPGGGDQQPVADPAVPVEGVVGRVEVDQGFFTITGPDGIPREITFGSSPRILLNGKAYITARDLEPDDRVVILQGLTDSGRPRLEIAVARPDHSVGYVLDIQPQLEQLSVQLTEGTQRGQLLIRAGAKTRVELNGQPAEFSELKAGDEIQVRHVPDDRLESGRIATEIVALQKRRMDGFVRDVAPGMLTIETHRQGKTELKKLPVTDDCEVTVNGKKIVDSRLLKPADLAPGDRVTVSHHIQIVAVQALRQFQHSGSLLELRPENSTLVVSEGNTARKVFLATDDCAITINGETAALTDLRRNDRLDLSYDSTNQQNDVSAIDAIRPVNEKRLAVVIGNQHYDDNSLSRLSFSAADARLIHQTLLTRYACGPDRTLLLVDETRVRIEQALPDWLKQADSGSQVLVFVVGHAYMDDSGQPFLAARDFALARTADTGIPLSWLREQLESCVAQEKLLLLDTSREGVSTDLARQPSPVVMLDAIRPAREPAVFRSTWAITACAADQKGQDWVPQQHGLFAWFVAQGLSGSGDRNQDVHLEPTELFDYLKTSMSAIQIDQHTQHPQLFRPDDTPPPMDRLSPEAREAIRNLLASHWTSRRRLPESAGAEFLKASELAGGEPDARMTWALLLLRSRDYREAEKTFDQLRLSHPRLTLPYEALAWLRAYSGHPSESLSSLTSLVKLLKPAPDEAPVPAAESHRLLEFSGRIREYLHAASDPARRPSDADLKQLDNAVGELDQEAAAAYAAGQMAVQRQITDYSDRIGAEKDSARVTLLQLERRRLDPYVDFDSETARRSIAVRLDARP